MLPVSGARSESASGSSGSISVKHQPSTLSIIFHAMRTIIEEVIVQDVVVIIVGARCSTGHHSHFA